MHSPQKIKLSEQTAERLFERIVDERRYGPGEKLPNENDLSAELGVSRTTLREAISFWWPRGCWRSAGERAPMLPPRCLPPGLT